MKTIKIIAYIIFLLFVVPEVTLRLQQKIGPIYDLEMKEVTLASLSDILNHKNVTNFYNGKQKEVIYYEENGIRINKSRPEIKNNENNVTVFFMGDSFMKGYDDDNTIPQHIWTNLKKRNFNQGNITFFNAGANSYSPLIFIPQAKILIPITNPDFVVVDIDETDLGDDYIKYKNLIVRDDNGKIVAVKRNPVSHLFLNGFIQIRKQPLFISRFLLKVYHTNFYIPIVKRKYRKTDPRNVLSFSWDTDKIARRKYYREINFFKKNIDELLETLISLIGDKKKILIIYHPHLHHVKPNEAGLYWNTFVSDAIQEVCDKYRVNFYNATQDLKEAFQGNPEKYYFSNDMHFNYKGLKTYSDFLTERLIEIIKESETFSY